MPKLPPNCKLPPDCKLTPDCKSLLEENDNAYNIINETIANITNKI